MAAPPSPLDGGRAVVVAGDLGAGFNGDGPVATFADLNYPGGIALDAAGRLVIADGANYRLRRIVTTSVPGAISTIAGTGIEGDAGDGGPATAAELSFMSYVAADGHGNLYESNGVTSLNTRVRKIDATGKISAFAGIGAPSYAGDGGPATAANLEYPGALAVDPAGDVFIAEGVRVRKVDPSGMISTYAGTSVAGFSGDGKAATAATLEQQPAGLATDALGDLFIATGNRVRKISAAGIITTIAGSASAGYSGDGGPARAATLDGPTGLATDAAGDVYIADSGNHRVRVINAAGVISTVAGTGVSGFSYLYGPAKAMKLQTPHGVAVDARGSLYISDTQGQFVVKVTRPLTASVAGGCNKLAARALVERGRLGGFTGFIPEPVFNVVCGPLLGRHSHAMIVNLRRPTCRAAGGWVVFRHVGTGWRRVTRVHGIFEVVRRSGRGFIDYDPVPRGSETLCTTRHWQAARWHWNGRRLVHGRFHSVRPPKGL